MEKGKLLDRAALSISRIFHPFLVGVPLGLLYLFYAGIGISEAAKWVSIAAAIGLLPAALFLKFHPDYNLRDVNPREKRNPVYLLVMVEIIAIALVFKFLNAPHSAMVSVYSAILTIPAGGAVNHYTKLSVHTAVLSGFSTAFLFVYTPAGLAGFAATLITSWARVRLDRHEPHQVALGLLVPAATVGATFYLLF